MHFDKTNFFRHFNPIKKQNYSNDEIRFHLECIGRVKAKRLVDGKINNISLKKTCLFQI